jgi:S-adenosylmethionine synthetase
MRYFTSESVTEGHPDKVADRISDSVLDAVLARDPMGRVACETLVTKDRVIVAGETTSDAGLTTAEIETVARLAIGEIGYIEPGLGFDAENAVVEVILGRQSPDISAGVSASLEAREGSVDPLDELGAGDQGLMFGYAVEQTAALMPLPIQLAHRLAEQLSRARKDGTLDYLRPDGKTQVTVAYDGKTPSHIERILISTQHKPGVNHDRLTPDLWEHIVKPVADAALLTEATKFNVNPSGQFEIGGPQADAGLTGRKIIVDTYGGYARHGGGAFSGKDPTKVDRSAAYAARHVAKTVVAAGLAQECEIQVAYAIGSAHPFSVFVETFGSSVVDERQLSAAILDVFDLRPQAIIDGLDLRRPIYGATSAYGHFGRSEFPWEATARVADLRAAVESR